MRAPAAMLFEELLRSGLNPGMGAAAARRYVSRKATITILNHRKTADGGIRPWEFLGVSERRYYKLLKQFAHRNGARYEVDAGVLEQIRRHLISRDQKTEKQAAASRGWHMRNPLLVRQEEIGRAIDNATAGTSRRDRPEVFTLDPDVLYATPHSPEPEPTGLPEYLDWLCARLTAVSANFGLLMDPERIAPEKTSGWCNALDAPGP